MRFHGFHRSGVWKPVAACGELWHRGPAPIETFARSWLAAWLADCWLLAGLAGVGCLATCGGLWHRGPAPKETFARSQLAAIIDSSIHQIWRWLTAISQISGVGARRPVAAFGIEVQPL